MLRGGRGDKHKIVQIAVFPIIFVTDRSFQGVNRLFVLAFEDDAQRASNKRYIPNVEIKYFNVMIDGKKVLDQTIKNNKVTYENIWKIAIGHGDDYTTGYLLDYTYLKKIIR